VLSYSPSLTFAGVTRNGRFVISHTYTITRVSFLSFTFPTNWDPDFPRASLELLHSVVLVPPLLHVVAAVGAELPCHVSCMIRIHLKSTDFRLTYSIRGRDESEAVLLPVALSHYKSAQHSFRLIGGGLLSPHYEIRC
jgi:hypothetical protein